MNMVKETCGTCGRERFWPESLPVDDRLCARCAPPDVLSDAFAKAKRGAVDLYWMGHDPYSDGVLLWDGERYVSVSGHVMRIIRHGDLMPGGKETVITDNQKLRDENRDLHAENSRLRRALERAGR